MSDGNTMKYSRTTTEEDIKANEQYLLDQERCEDVQKTLEDIVANIEREEE